MLFRSGGENSTQKRLSAQEILQSPCWFHSKDGKPAGHTTSQCFAMKDIDRLRAGGKPNDKDAGQQPPAGNGFPEHKGALHTFVSFNSRREEKLIKRAVHATLPPVPQYLNWSEQPITWSRQDHPVLVPCPGKFALVVAPQVKGYVLSKTLMDGGSSINILYYETFKHMKLPENLI